MHMPGLKCFISLPTCWFDGSGGEEEEEKWSCEGPRSRWLGSLSNVTARGKTIKSPSDGRGLADGSKGEGTESKTTHMHELLDKRVGIC